MYYYSRRPISPSPFHTGDAKVVCEYGMSITGE